jgi:cytochrome c553
MLARKGDAALQIPACVQCHGTALTGVQPSTPGLLGLPRDYLNAQLGGWQTGQRKAHAPDCMAAIARRLSDADVHAVTSWLASQTVPQNAHPAPRKPALAVGATAIDCGSAP